jgi:hypothetical protein
MTGRATPERANVLTWNWAALKTAARAATGQGQPDKWRAIFHSVNTTDFQTEALPKKRSKPMPLHRS